jgi:hypothetical protein
MPNKIAHLDLNSVLHAKTVYTSLAEAYLIKVFIYYIFHHYIRKGRLIERFSQESMSLAYIIGVIHIYVETIGKVSLSICITVPALPASFVVIFESVPNYLFQSASSPRFYRGQSSLFLDKRKFINPCRSYTDFAAHYQFLKLRYRKTLKTHKA